MHWSPATSLVLAFARLEAQRAGFAEFEPEHLFMGLCRLAELVESNQADRLNGLSTATVQAIEVEGRALAHWFAQAQVAASSARRAIREQLGQAVPNAVSSERPDASHEAEQRIQWAWEYATRTNLPSIQPIHLAQAVVAAPTSRLAANLLKVARQSTAATDPNTPPHDARTTAIFEPPPIAHAFSETKIAPKPEPVPAPAPALAPSAKPPAAVASFGRDLTALARANQLPPLIGRKEEVKHLMRVLAQQRKNNAILVGDPGVGKTCIAYGLAHLIASGRAPGRLKETKLFELSLPRLIAGTKHRGELEQRLEGIIREAATDPTLVLFIDEIHTLIGAGKGGDAALDAANIVKPALADGRLRVIGATTTDEFEKYFARDGAFERRFETVWIDEPDRDEGVEILRGLGPGLQTYHGVEISESAIAAAVDLSIRFIPSRRLPDKAIDLLDQACANRSLDSFSFADVENEASATRSSANRPVISPDDVVAVLAELANVPRELIVASDAERMDQMAGVLNERIIGQTTAIEQVVGALRSAYLGIRDPRRPVASFLFFGPTGVGKTETAKVAAEFLFGHRDRLIRLDMSEYSEKHQIARLLGAPPGYTGHDEPGVLTAAMRQSPASVVLFDEIEKAHPDVLNILLQILDEGMLTDSRGRHMSFREAIVILTTNLSPQSAPGIMPGGVAPMPATSGNVAPAAPTDDSIVRGFASHLKPELLGRIGRIVGFRSLARRDWEAIALRRLQSIVLQLRSQGIHATPPADVAAKVAAECLSMRFGARELERRVDAAVAEWLDRQHRGAIDCLPPGSDEYPLPMVVTTGTDADAGVAAEVKPHLPDAVPVEPSQPTGRVREAMLRGELGGIFHLRARAVLDIGRHERSTWPVFLTPRTPENDQASLSISRNHLRMVFVGQKFGAEDVGSSAGTWIGTTRLKPHARFGFGDGALLNVGGVLTIRANLFSDLRVNAPGLVESAVEPLANVPVTPDAQLGYNCPGTYRSVRLRRTNNRIEERCVWLIKYCLLGADASLCEIDVLHAPRVAAEVRWTGSGFVVAAQSPDVTLNGDRLPLGTIRPLRNLDSLKLSSNSETLTFIERLI